MAATFPKAGSPVAATLGTITVSGGALGTGVGSGTNGTAGANGFSLGVAVI